MTAWKRLIPYLVVAVLASAATVAVEAASSGAQAKAEQHRTIHVPLGTYVTFDGLGWFCNYQTTPDPVGVLSGPSQTRPAVFCTYLVNDGGCPFLEMANPYLWIGDSRTPLALRRTSTGAGYIRTHFGCN